MKKKLIYRKEKQVEGGMGLGEKDEGKMGW